MARTAIHNAGGRAADTGQGHVLCDADLRRWRVDAVGDPHRVTGPRSVQGQLDRGGGRPPVEVGVPVAARRRHVVRGTVRVLVRAHVHHAADDPGLAGHVERAIHPAAASPRVQARRRRQQAEVGPRAVPEERIERQAAFARNRWRGVAVGPGGVGLELVPVGTNPRAVLPDHGVEDAAAELAHDTAAHVGTVAGHCAVLQAAAAVAVDAATVIVEGTGRCVVIYQAVPRRAAGL